MYLCTLSRNPSFPPPRRNALLVSSIVHVGFPGFYHFISIYPVSWIIIQYTLVDDNEETSVTWYGLMSTAVVGGQAP